MFRRRRIGAYGVCRDARGRVLLVRAARGTQYGGVWLLPGGGVEHGEHPDDAVAREFSEETGLGVVSAHPREIGLSLFRSGDQLVHNDRIIYDVVVGDGDLRAETDGSTDRARWFDDDEVADTTVTPSTARVLGAGRSAPGLSPADVAATAAMTLDPPPPGRPSQRFGAYGLAIDPAGRILLVRADTATGWGLPGAETAFGESAAEGLERALGSGYGRATEVLHVAHRVHSGDVLPAGHLIDVVMRLVVTAPIVASGFAWFESDELRRLDLDSMTRAALASVRAPADRAGC